MQTSNSFFVGALVDIGLELSPTRFKQWEMLSRIVSINETDKVRFLAFTKQSLSRRWFQIVHVTSRSDLAPGFCDKTLGTEIASSTVSASNLKVE